MKGINMNRDTAAKIGVFLGLVGLCALIRLVPHPPNFTPVAAAALFAGFFFERRAVALAVPLLAVLVSDSLLGTYSTSVMVAVYFAHSLPVLMGTRLSHRFSALKIGGSAVLASLVFFVLTNLAVWHSGVLYERTAAGLLGCFSAALPFWQHTLTGNLLWSAVIFGGYAASTRIADHLTERKLVRQAIENN